MSKMKFLGWKKGFVIFPFFFAGILLLLSGCQATKPPEIQIGPARSAPAAKGVDKLVEDLIAGNEKFETLKADVQVAMVSPLLQQPPQLNLSGRLAVKKNEGGDRHASIRLRISPERRSEGITMIGDGEYFDVDMPLLNMSYSGHYDETHQEKEKTIHFTPLELANVFNLEHLLRGRVHTLRAYPAHWDHSALRGGEAVEFPPKWAIDSLQIEDRDHPYPWTHNSLVLDRRTETLLKIDSFRPDGSLMSRIWVLAGRIASGGERGSVRIPSELQIWYPPPLENTVIRVRLSNIVLNVEIEDDLFSL